MKYSRSWTLAVFIQGGARDKRLQIGGLMSSHGLEPGETLFIGDMQHEIETARHGGVLSCAVLTGYNGLEQLRASAPDLIVEHLGELQAILETFQRGDWRFLAVALGIEAAWVVRMASQQALCCEPDPLEDPVPIDGLQRVMRAARTKSAGGGERRCDPPLIKQDESSYDDL